ncbi:hypothetical protein SO694_00187018 [Aureococcus anophagefferens]|uniref:Sulfotransferase domain-containing protein n=1 Tax=Aureococcus anophagefferens TaxID=44056 RepID=A0ABR1FGA3_AURAN
MAKFVHALLAALARARIPGCTPQLPLPTVIHIPKTGGTQAAGGVLKYDANHGHDVAFPLPLLLGGRTCNWHHIPPRYFNASGGAATNPYHGRRTVCFVREPISRWISQWGYKSQVSRQHPSSAHALNAYTRQWLGDLVIERRRDGDFSAALARRAAASFAPSAYAGPERPQKSVMDFGLRNLDPGTLAWDPQYDCHLIPQSTYVWDAEGRRTCDEILRTSNITNELRRFKALACKEPPAPHGRRLRSPLDPVTSSHQLTADDLRLDPELVDALRVLYAEDYAKLGAYFDAPPPA